MVYIGGVLPPPLFIVAPLILGGAGDGLDDLLTEHCLDCHQGDRPKGGFGLEELLGESRDEGREEWAWIKERLLDGTMPPSDRPRPTDQALEEALHLLEFAQAPEEVVPSQRGRIRRLTRRELLQSVEDLTGVALPQDSLPVEANVHTFDVVQAGFTMDAEWIDLWLDLVLDLSAEAIALPEPEPAPPQRATAEQLSGPGGSNGRLYTVGVVSAPFQLPRAGRYRFIASAWAQQGGDELARVELRHDSQVLLATELQGDGRGALQRLVVEADLPAGAVDLGLAFLNDHYRPATPEQEGEDRNVYVEELQLEGPLDVRPPTSFQVTLLRDLRGGGSEEAIIEAVVRRLTRRAWRRSARAPEVLRIVEIAMTEEGLQRRMRLALAAVLASPHFLYCAPTVTEDPALARRSLVERMSLGLWGALPDRELLLAAERGSLDDPEGRLAQLDRMLGDPRSQRFVEGFTPQWLQLGRLSTHRPDPVSFPDYDPELRDSMLAEPLALFRSVLEQDLGVSALVGATWTQVDARLAAHYGLRPEEVASDGRVVWDASPRRGLLGHAALLTASSAPDRTSPVLRGKWVLEALLGSPPPPPPPGVATLDETAPFEPGLSTRARLERHREDPGCAGCHDGLDPLGFALETFDPVGRMREGEVDSSGELPDGTQLSGPLDLARLLAKDPRFRRHLGRALATYLLAELMTPEEEAWLDHAVEGLGPDPTLRDLLGTIVQAPFFDPRGAR